MLSFEVLVSVAIFLAVSNGFILNHRVNKIVRNQKRTEVSEPADSSIVLTHVVSTSDSNVVNYFVTSKNALNVILNRAKVKFELEF